MICHTGQICVNQLQKNDRFCHWRHKKYTPCTCPMLSSGVHRNAMLSMAYSKMVLWYARGKHQSTVKNWSWHQQTWDSVQAVHIHWLLCWMYQLPHDHQRWLLSSDTTTYPTEIPQPALHSVPPDKTRWLQCVAKKVSPKVFCHFLSNRSEFLNEISCIYYSFIIT